MSSSSSDAAEPTPPKNATETRHLDPAFVRKFSHDLTTPLNGILGFTELLLDERHGPLNELQLEFLALVRQSGQDLLRLVRSFADVADSDSAADTEPNPRG